MEYKETVKKVIAEVCRLLLGVVFIFSGTVKAVDPMGGAIKIGDYLTSFGLWSSCWVSVCYWGCTGGIRPS